MLSVILTGVVFVSIHAPARGATLDRHEKQLENHVSIHAPARGATRHSRAATVRLRSFNPRARAGRDAIEASVADYDAQFQSTRPRGARRYDFAFSSWAFLFQSTRPRGARPLLLAKGFDTLVFQSTRPRGARLRDIDRTRFTDLFQSTRPRGARPMTNRWRH